VASSVTTSGSLGANSSSQIRSSKTKAPSPAKNVIASLLEQSSRHLFGPTSQPALPPKQQVVSITGLTEKLHYLKPEEVNQIKKAFQFADAAHLGQYHHSGEPYITILANRKK